MNIQTHAHIHSLAIHVPIRDDKCWTYRYRQIYVHIHIHIHIHIDIDFDVDVGNAISLHYNQFCKGEWNLFG